MRMLITGSRDWTDGRAVERAMIQAVRDLGDRVTPITVVHGDAPGADNLADQVARKYAMNVERHPADWTVGRKAGPLRNAAMVARGADVCLAFIGDCSSPRCRKPGPHPSHGATGCAALAEEAGIPVRRIQAAIPTHQPDQEENQ